MGADGWRRFAQHAACRAGGAANGTTWCAEAKAAGARGGEAAAAEASYGASALAPAWTTIAPRPARRRGVQRAWARTRGVADEALAAAIAMPPKIVCALARHGMRDGDARLPPASAARARAPTSAAAAPRAIGERRALAGTRSARCVAAVSRGLGAWGAGFADALARGEGGRRPATLGRVGEPGQRAADQRARPTERARAAVGGSCVDARLGLELRRRVRFRAVDARSRVARVAAAVGGPCGSFVHSAPAARRRALERRSADGATSRSASRR